MSTVGRIAPGKGGRARREPARPKSGEEAPKKGSHERRNTARASRTGHGREIGTFMAAQEVIEVHTPASGTSDFVLPATKPAKASNVSPGTPEATSCGQ